jgi:hypothetical protein
VKLTVTTEIGDGPRRYSAKIVIETYVRDVIDLAHASEEPHQ